MAFPTPARGHGSTTCSPRCAGSGTARSPVRPARSRSWPQADRRCCSAVWFPRLSPGSPRSPTGGWRRSSGSTCSLEALLRCTGPGPTPDVRAGRGWSWSATSASARTPARWRTTTWSTTTDGNYFPAARADTLTTSEAIDDERRRLRDVGCDDLLLFRCSPGIDQVSRLAEVLDSAGVAASYSVPPHA